MDPLTIALTLIGLLIAGLGSWYTYLAYKREHTPPSSSTPRDDHKGVPLPERLLRFLWEYPEHGGSRASWAAKESLILRGRLEGAREEPGLGIAIVTTELALNVFGSRANSRIDGCVTWALGKSFDVPPYFLKGKEVDSRTSEEKEVPDFRHSLAFGIILARTRKLKDRASEFLRCTLDRQNANGGWPVGQGRTLSEVFTVFYAIEFLDLCVVDKRLSQEMRSKAQASRDRGAAWLISNLRAGGLWESGVLSDYPWDGMLTTAWVLHRMAPLEDIAAPHWVHCLTHAASSMVNKAADAANWRSSPDLQRFRVEARVAAAVARVLEAKFPDFDGCESLQIFLSDWRRRAGTFAMELSYMDWDIGTAAFVLQAMFSTTELMEWVDKAGLARR